MNLEDETLAWHPTYLRCRDPHNLAGWEEYLSAITETFDDDFADPMIELKQLRQTGSFKNFRWHLIVC